MNPLSGVCIRTIGAPPLTKADFKEITKFTKTAAKVEFVYSLDRLKKAIEGQCMTNRKL